ncbi:MAG: amidase [Alphaproteobacteria bacterium]|nr:amidase [Alphaproteobacteria bacterium]
MSDEIAMMSATELRRRYRTKQLSPVEATTAVLRRIEARDPALNAFRFVAHEAALEAARRSEARWAKGAPCGLLDGVPTTIKDQWLAKGWPTLKGSRTIAPEGAWDEDSPAVARLREHGAILLGKTNMPEFGWKGVTDSPLTGISRNPWNPAKTCGGSSGGAAIAAASGMGMLNIGSDGAGSIRIPAAFCGIYGLKPTYGRVPAYPHGLLPLCSHTGPMVRTVADAALMLTVIAEPDPRDWLQLPAERRDWRIGIEGGVGGLRIAYSRTLGHGWVDPEIGALVDKAAAIFAELGAHVEEADPGFPDPRAPFEMFYTGSMSATLDGIPAEKRALMDPGYIEMAERGRRYSGGDLLRAWAARDALGRHMNAFHERYDLLLTPQLPLAAFDVGMTQPKTLAAMFDWLPFTFPFNFTQQPAASVPCGFTADGLPAAVQIVAARYREDLVLRASRAYESAHPFKMPA